MKLIAIYLLLFFPCFLTAQNSYAPPAGEPGTTAMHKDSLAFVSWASQASIYRGYIDISQKNLGRSSAGLSSAVLGKAQENGVISLGDSGYVDLQFDGKIFDGPGADFAVFENAFDGYFLELAFVEVSSDGQNFFRFPAVSLTDTNNQVGSFDSLDARNIHNLAGKYQSGYGVPFDLNELAGNPGLDIQQITHVRILDVVGSLSDNYGSRDALGRKINDPFPTPFPTGGFDLDAVGVIHLQPSSIEELSSEMLQVFPNPARDIIQIANAPREARIQAFNANGQQVYSGKVEGGNIDLSHLKPGMYFLVLETKEFRKRAKLILE